MCFIGDYGNRQKLTGKPKTLAERRDGDSLGGKKGYGQINAGSRRTILAAGVPGEGEAELQR